MFYSQLSAYYDRVFPFKQPVLDFLLMYLPPTGRILDAACGTGTYSIPLAKQGYDVIGLDLETEMIKQARAKDSARQVDFQVRDMLDLADLGTFNGLVCLGNSLAHLTDESQIDRFFANASDSLSSDGILIIQVVNFDKVMATFTPSHLPLLGDELVRFTRVYRPVSSEEVAFESTLEVADGNIYTNTIKLRPILRAELEKKMMEAGFGSIQVFGDYQGGEFDARQSPSLILIGRRNS